MGSKCPRGSLLVFCVGGLKATGRGPGGYPCQDVRSLPGSLCGRGNFVRLFQGEQGE